MLSETLPLRLRSFPFVVHTVPYLVLPWLWACCCAKATIARLGVYDRDTVELRYTCTASVVLLPNPYLPPANPLVKKAGALAKEVITGAGVG